MSRRVVEAAAFLGLVGYFAAFGVALLLIATKP
jgi:hypothetical protein